MRAGCSNTHARDQPAAERCSPPLFPFVDARLPQSVPLGSTVGRHRHTLICPARYVPLAWTERESLCHAEARRTKGTDFQRADETPNRTTRQKLPTCRTLDPMAVALVHTVVTTERWTSDGKWILVRACPTISLRGAWRFEFWFLPVPRNLQRTYVRSQLRGANAALGLPTGLGPPAGVTRRSPYALRWGSLTTTH